MTNLIDLATLTDHNNYSYRTQQDLLFYAAGDDLDMIGMSFILPANSTVWYYSEDPGRRRSYFVDKKGRVGYLSGSLSELGTKLFLTAGWVSPKPAHVPGTVTHGDALERLQV